jgi:hypothetical protein
MKLCIALFALLGVGASGACAAADPPAPDASVPAASASNPSTPSAAPATANSSASTVTVTGKQEDPDVKQLLLAGYKPEMHNGEKVYCRYEDETGSRLSRKRVCGSVQQVKSAVEQNQSQMLEDLKHNHTMTYH